MSANVRHRVAAARGEYTSPARASEPISRDTAGQKHGECMLRAWGEYAESMPRACGEYEESIRRA